MWIDVVLTGLLCRLYMPDGTGSVIRLSMNCQILAMFMSRGGFRL
jgi:hypothetical protein